MARERLGELLLRAGVLTQAQLVAALRDQQRTGVRLGQILIDHGFVEEVTLYDAIAKITGLERFNLRTAILEKSTLNLVTAEWAFENGAAPYKIDVQARIIYVAITDPTNLKPVDEIAFRRGLKPKAVIASETELQRVLRHHFHGEVLDRDPRTVRRPGGPVRTRDDADFQLIQGMDSEREELQRRRAPSVIEQTPQPEIPEPLADSSDLPTDPRMPDPFVAQRGGAQLVTGRVATSEARAFEPPREAEGVAIEPDRLALARLKPVYEAQEEVARALRAIFELCVAKGIIRREEYLERLKRAE
ncbi:hypothetical protein L6R52_17765 [Myxococcota bacterium]|nr:hypothetical protein [Myxococcota bacterium]